MFQLQKATSQEDVLKLAEMAREIWRECFPTVISEGQIEHMLERFQSYRAIQSQIQEQGCVYYFIVLDGNIIGYTAIQAEEEKMFLSKFYLYEAYRGKGYARKAMDELIRISTEQGKHALHLNTNRNNVRAIKAYHKLGFTITGTEVADIGGGYVADDYLLELTW